jgi:hypothetical protein
MSEKKYCFVPRHEKFISVFNSNNESLKHFSNEWENDFLSATQADLFFKHCIDIEDKVKLFFVNGQNTNIIDDYDYFRYKTLTAIKALFSQSEIVDYKLVMEESYFTFTIIFDSDGNPCSKQKLGDLNKTKTIVAHTYVYDFYEKYKRKAG